MLSQWLPNSPFRMQQSSNDLQLAKQRQLRKLKTF